MKCSGAHIYMCSSSRRLLLQVGGVRNTTGQFLSLSLSGDRTISRVWLCEMPHDASLQTVAG